MPAPRLLLQDACVLINLVASGCFEEIARHGGFRFVVSAAVAAETYYTREAGTGEKVPVDLAPYFAAGLLERLDLETEQEQVAYVTFAAQQLGDGEAMSLALAQARRLPLAMDDRLARRLAAREDVAVELHSTVSVLQRWESLCRVERLDLARVLDRIQQGARFAPRPGTPEHVWWMAGLEGRSVS